MAAASPSPSSQLAIVPQTSTALPPQALSPASTSADSPSPQGGTDPHNNSNSPPPEPPPPPPPVDPVPSSATPPVTPPPALASPPTTSAPPPPPSTQLSPPPPPPTALSPPSPPPLSPPLPSLSSSPPPSATPPSNSPSATPSSTPPATPPSAPLKPPPPPAAAASPPSSNPPPPSSNPPPSPPSNSPPPPPASSSNTSSSPPVVSSPPTTTPPSAPVSHLSPPPSPSNPSPPSQTPPANTNGNNTSSNAPQSAGSKSGGLSAGTIAVIGVVLGFIIIGLIVFSVWRQRKGRRRPSEFDDGFDMGSSPRSDSNLIIKTSSGDPFLGSGNFSPPDHGALAHSRSWFTYQELIDATNGFPDENLLGEGGFGFVYKGCLTDGREVAVKQLKIGGRQGEREFKAEVEIISRIHHRHLVSLVGFCIHESLRLLVYDYVPNNTLYYHLHGKGCPVMDWTRRFKIAAGAARGIAYLHEDCHPRIIHRDIKSSNILLDSNYEAQVSDFGLAKLALDADTHVSTRVMGTFGYMAPEYVTSGKLTEKSDVYSFGVVLLELLTGRKPVGASQPDESLVEWARPWLSHAVDTREFESLLDPRLGENYVESEVLRMIEAAAACVRHSSAKRPRMGQIVRAFDSIASPDLNNGMRVGESQVYDPAQQSAELGWFRRMAFGNQDYITDLFTDPVRSQGSRSSDS